jgi:hypothetical protein
MANYVKNVPRDVGGIPLQEFPAPTRAITSVMMLENDNVSSVLILDKDTSSVEVSAFGGQGVAIRWVASGETAAVSPRGSVIASGLLANFDHHIPSGQVRRFAIPVEKTGQVAGGNVGSVNGLYARLGHVNAGPTASSILIVQY